ncbi:MAG TPA: hypothetical protein VNQ90_03880, partial [Chthoniobacteraceae bacterium]|nr:hypothetical protein [Chthoniobacteraceae bacterium]
MSKPSALLVAFLIMAAASPAPAVDGTPPEKGVIYSWNGSPKLPAGLPSPPSVKAPDPKLGSQRQLVFSDTRQIAIPLTRRTLRQFTVALYLRPGRGKVTESLISCGTLETDGFLLYRMHSNWGFGAGDGTTFARRHMNRRAEFLSRKWQHLAVT